MSPRLLSLPLFLLLLLPALLQARGWPQDKSDLAADPAAHFGQLENGLRYVLLPNAEPPGRLSLRLLVEAGSLQETDSQRGLAHFLEHMAFNGTTRFPSNEMVEYFQRLGMGFGADTNAHTGFDETVYKLELPNTDEALLEDAFRLLRDYADGMLLTPEEVEKERGVIIAEMEARDSHRYRTMVAEFEFALPGTIVPLRLPIGTREVIESKDVRERLARYYEEWYVANNMTLVAVGEIDQEKLVGLIEQNFKDLHRHHLPPIDLGKVVAHEEPYGYHYEPEASATHVSVQANYLVEAEADALVPRVREFFGDSAVAVINRRLERLAKEEGAPFSEGTAYNWSMFDRVRSIGLELTCQPADWQKALAVAENELRRSLEHGFTDAEVAEIRQRSLNALEQAAKGASTRRSRDLSSAIVDAISSEDVFMHPEQTLEAMRNYIEKLSPEDCHNAWKSLWQQAEHGQLVFVSGNVELDEGAVATIRDTFSKAKEVAVEAPEQLETAEWAYASKPRAFEAKETHIEDLDIWQFVLPNGVRVNYKQTDFKKNEVVLTARAGQGVLAYDADKPGLPELADAAFMQGGLGSHDADELERLLAGRTVALGFSVGEAAFTFQGRTNAEDLQLTLELLCAWLSDAAYRPESLRLARKGFQELYPKLRHDFRGVLSNRLLRFLAKDDPRFGYPEEEELMKRDLDELRAWLTPQLTKGYLEVSLVGDVAPERVREAVAATLGALSERAAEKTVPEGSLKLDFPSEVEHKDIPYESTVEQGLAALYFKTTDGWDISKTRRLNILSSVLDDRLRVKVREELGDAYSPFARNRASYTFEDYGNLGLIVPSNPKDGEKLCQILREMAAELREKGSDADEVERALKPILESISKTERENGYWLGVVLTDCQEHPARLDFARSRAKDYASITVEDINALAKEYLVGKGTAVTVRAVAPEVAESSEGSQEE